MRLSFNTLIWVLTCKLVDLIIAGIWFVIVPITALETSCSRPVHHLRWHRPHQFPQRRTQRPSLTPDLGQGFTDPPTSNGDDLDFPSPVVLGTLDSDRRMKEITDYIWAMKPAQSEKINLLWYVLLVFSPSRYIIHHLETWRQRNQNIWQLVATLLSFYLFFGSLQI